MVEKAEKNYLKESIIEMDENQVMVNMITFATTLGEVNMLNVFRNESIVVTEVVKQRLRCYTFDPYDK